MNLTKAMREWRQTLEVQLEGKIPNSEFIIADGVLITAMEAVRKEAIEECAIKIEDQKDLSGEPTGAWDRGYDQAMKDMAKSLRSLLTNNE